MSLIPKYLVEIPLSREEYQLLCRALIKVEVELREDKERDVLFWGSDSAEQLADVRTTIRRGFTLAFGGSKLSKEED